MLEIAYFKQFLEHSSQTATRNNPTHFAVLPLELQINLFSTHQQFDSLFNFSHQNNL
jgi:hypothetical protein